MINVLRFERTKKTRSRKFPFLPRFGVVVDIGGHRVSYRQAPLLETLANLIERGATRTNFNKIVSEQLYEITLPSLLRKKTVTVEAKTIKRSLRSLGKFS